jgi:hypothetical protein
VEAAGKLKAVSFVAESVVTRALNDGRLELLTPLQSCSERATVTNKTSTPFEFRGQS